MIIFTIVLVMATFIDILGYVIRCFTDPEFDRYHLRRIPFMWIFYASKS